ncbi:sensor histidine kinase [Flavobacterium sp.]|jgi:signal transduction histidine kinase|uniref:sensor histidine kinase n=1 Tax=Flavobacterium sp. TaxID=239 RepID=UPI0037C1227A
MKKKLVGFIICLLCFCSCRDAEKFSDNDAVQDSIRYYLNKSADLKRTNEEIANTTAKAHELIKQTKIDSLYIINNFLVSYVYDNIGEKDLFREINREMVEVAKKLNDSINLARAYVHIGESYASGINIDSTFYYYTKAERIYLKKGDNLGVGKVNLKKASQKYQLGDYFGCEKTAVVASSYIRFVKNVEQMFNAYTLMGLACIETKDFLKAQDYFSKAYNLITSNLDQKFSVFQLKALAINNLAYLNIEIKNYKKALVLVEEALNEPNLEEEYPRLYATLLFNRGRVNLKLKNYSIVVNDLHKSKVIRKKFKLLSAIANSEMALSNYFDAIKEKDSALFYAQSAYKNAKETGILSLHLDAVDVLVNIDEENFAKHSKERIQLSDSLINTERKIAEKFARIEFETDEMILEKEKAEQEREQMLLILVLVLFSGGLLLIILWQRNKQKQLVLINNQQKASEEIYQLLLDQQIKFDEGREKEKKRIARELHDGIMNNLAGIRYNLFRLEKKRDDETIESCIHHIEELHTVEKEIRNIAHDLNLDVFSPKNDYASLLNTLVRENEYEGVYITLEVQNEIVWESVSSIIKMNCYRILQECFNNIRKHSQATEVNVHFQLMSEQLILEILDNGLGFDPKKTKSGFGLSSIKERVRTMKGTYIISSKKKKGTTIKVNIPL